jgi:hypothetical protein
VTVQRAPLLKMNAAHTVAYFAELLDRAAVPDRQRLVIAATEALGGGTPALQHRLEQHWYLTLRAGAPDYTVYDTDDYLVEAVHCWWAYSRPYLRNCGKPGSLPPDGVWARFADASTIVDVGNGLGFTSAALRLLHPAARVVGTNMPGSTQYRIASHLADAYGFTMVPDVHTAPTAPDLVWATEYFEHFQSPLDHADEVIGTLQPRALLIANTFGGDATGHFDTYTVNGEELPCRSVARLFNQNLRRHGYRKVATTMWNGRPTLWELEQ